MLLKNFVINKPRARHADEVPLASPRAEELRLLRLPRSRGRAGSWLVAKSTSKSPRVPPDGAPVP